MILPKFKSFVVKLSVVTFAKYPVAHLLVSEGFKSIEAVAFVPLEELQSIEGFDENLAKELKEEEEKAREELSKQVEAKEEENIAEGKLEIDDPIEEKVEDVELEKDEVETKENSDTEEITEKKPEKRFKI